MFFFFFFSFFLTILLSYSTGAPLAASTLTMNKLASLVHVERVCTGRLELTAGKRTFVPEVFTENRSNERTNRFDSNLLDGAACACACLVTAKNDLPCCESRRRSKRGIAGENANLLWLWMSYNLYNKLISFGLNWLFKRALKGPDGFEISKISSSMSMNIHISCS